jgi:four helix bundle protein
VNKLKIQYHWELDVYKLAREGRESVFGLSKGFPREELYSLTDQIRRSSRSVCAQIAEAWGRRLYRDDFVNRLNQAESEARETQSWLETAVECEYVAQETGKELFEIYHEVIGKLINMENNPGKWVIKARK